MSSVSVAFGRGVLAASFAGLLVLVTGCSDDGLPKRYPVTGNVTYKGKPLAQGKIDFIPEAADSRSATGTIVDGRYSLTTLRPEDGAMPGKYKVTVTSYEGDMAKVQEEASKQFGSKTAMPDQVAVGQAQRKPLIPEKYGSFEASGLTAQVNTSSNTIDFELKD